MFLTAGECPARGCRGEADSLGDHSLSCGIGGERIARHNHVRDALFQAAQQAGLAPVREAEGLIAGSTDRPADVLLRGWQAGRDTALDFIATNALQAATVVGCATDGAFAVEHAHDAKLRKYAARCEANGLAFIPLAVDTFGGWHPQALEVIGRLGRQLARATEGEQGQVVRHLRQRLGVLLVRDNVAMMGSRAPSFVPQEVDGVADLD